MEIVQDFFNQFNVPVTYKDLLLVGIMYGIIKLNLWYMDNGFSK